MKILSDVTVKMLKWKLGNHLSFCRIAYRQLLITHMWNSRAVTLTYPNSLGALKQSASRAKGTGPQIKPSDFMSSGVTHPVTEAYPEDKGNKTNDPGWEAALDQTALSLGTASEYVPQLQMMLSFDHHCDRMMIIICYTYKSPHSSTLAWKIPWTEEPGRLQSMGSLRVGHD